MLSILIPVYNYKINTLIRELLIEANTVVFNYEIIVLDDCSPNKQMADKNKLFCNKNKITYLQNETNLGRTLTRYQMAKIANYDSLLFLDSDVTPVKKNFLLNFSKQINNADVICGGVNYLNAIPEKDLRLRWKYGHERESISAELRNKKPYLSIISASFLIKKELFIEISNEIKDNNYGMDVLFSYQMEKRNLNVKHIDNPVYHLGLENNLDFIKKSALAMKTIVELQESNRIPNDYRPIQQKLISLKKTNLLSFFLYFVSFFSKHIINQLNSKNPNLFIFDIYRLYCLCLHYKQIS